MPKKKKRVVVNEELFDDPMKKKRLRDVIVVRRSVVILFLIVFFFLLIIVFNDFLGYVFDNLTGKTNACGDGSFYNTCSLNKPYFCKQGILLEKASTCGCEQGMKKQGERCVSNYNDGLENISLKYVLRGEENYVDFAVYDGVANYLHNLPGFISYSAEEKPFRVDFKLKHINNEIQKNYLLPLVVQIQNLAETKEDQMRIAVSLVQHIDFGESEEVVNLGNGYSVAYSRYPYEVLYDGGGVCGEKSELLAFLLREIGYGVILFYFEEENHEALGIKCPVRNSLEESGYCFIETSAPSIITDNEILYEDETFLFSSPEMMFISEGISLNKNLDEYDDAKDFKKIRKTLKERGVLEFLESEKLDNLKKKYGLVEIYSA